jgi:hypothetical protein
LTKLQVDENTAHHFGPLPLLIRSLSRKQKNNQAKKTTGLYCKHNLRASFSKEKKRSWNQQFPQVRPDFVETTDYPTTKVSIENSIDKELN